MNKDINLPEIDDKHDVLKINGQHGVCRSYYQPDELDTKTLDYAAELMQRSEKNLWALDLGCSPYFPESQRLAKLGFQVDAFDLEKPMNEFEKTNAKYHNCIHYKVKNIATLTVDDLRNDYQIIYSNRCLSFLTYQQAYRLIHTLVDQIKIKTRFFLSFFTQSAHYSDNYPGNLPLEKRYAPLNNAIAKGNEMLAPVCLYTRDEVIENLLGGLSIYIIEEIVTKSGSLKIIFEIN